MSFIHIRSIYNISPAFLLFFANFISVYLLPLKVISSVSQMGMDVGQLFCDCLYFN
jgi:hypothetical protein